MLVCFHPLAGQLAANWRSIGGGQSVVNWWPIQFNPAHPVCSDSMQFVSAQSSLVQSNPIQSGLVRSSLVQSGPFQSSPVSPAGLPGPAHSIPFRSIPRHPVPCQFRANSIPRQFHANSVPSGPLRSNLVGPVSHGKKQAREQKS